MFKAHTHTQSLPHTAISLCRDRGELEGSFSSVFSPRYDATMRQLHYAMHNVPSLLGAVKERVYATLAGLHISAACDSGML